MPPQHFLREAISDFIAHLTEIAVIKYFSLFKGQFFQRTEPLDAASIHAEARFILRRKIGDFSVPQFKRPRHQLPHGALVTVDKHRADRFVKIDHHGIVTRQFLNELIGILVRHKIHNAVQPALRDRIQFVLHIVIQQKQRYDIAVPARIALDILRDLHMIRICHLIDRYADMVGPPRNKVPRILIRNIAKFTHRAVNPFNFVLRNARLSVYDVRNRRFRYARAHCNLSSCYHNTPLTRVNFKLTRVNFIMIVS